MEHVYCPIFDTDQAQLTGLYFSHTQVFCFETRCNEPYMHNAHMFVYDKPVYCKVLRTLSVFPFSR
jgi:hypothetical protein